MKKLFSNIINMNSYKFGIIAFFTAIVVVFGVLPLLPDAQEGLRGPSLSAESAAAFGAGAFGNDASDFGNMNSDFGNGSFGNWNNPGQSGESATQATKCTITASKTQISAGQTASLTWTTQNATSVTLNQGIGSVSQNGSKTVSPNSQTNYVLTATGPNGTVNCEVCIEVVAAPAGLPSCSVYVNPFTINRGEHSTIHWSTTNATSVSLNQGIGRVSASGSKDLSPNETTVYTLTATGPGGTVNCEVCIVVDVPAATLPTCSFDVNPASIEKGSGSTLTWSTTHANSVTINQGIGGVGSNGSKVVYPTETKTYTLTATGDGGTINCEKTITVKTPTPSAPTCTLSVSPNEVEKNGHVTLTWSTQNASSVSINNGIGQVSTSGNRDVSVVNATSYVLTAEGNGKSVTCSKPVTIKSTPVPAPSCTLTLSPTSIEKGGSSVLNWSTQNATSVTLNQGIGSVVSTGSRTVQPETNTNYTLTVVGQEGKTVTCDTSLRVTEKPAVKPLTCDAFTASPSTLTGSGTTTLTWNTSEATEVSINQGVGAVAVDGSVNVPVSKSTTYTLTAKRGSETVSCNTQITINPVATKLPKCDAFSVNYSTVTRGSRVILTWDTSNASSVSINQGVGTVSTRGTREVIVNGDTTYVLTATNGSGTDSCQTSVSVPTGGSSSGGGGGGSSSPRCEFTASDKNVRSGDPVTLSWDNTRTNDIIIKDDRGNTLANSEKDSKIDEDEGSLKVRPSRTTTYTLTAIRGSQDRDCKVTVTVSEPVTVTSTRSQEPLVAGISLSQVPYTGFEAGPLLTSIFYAILVLWGFGVAYILVMRYNGTPAFGGVVSAGFGGLYTKRTKNEKVNIASTKASEATVPFTPAVMEMPASTYVSRVANAPTNLPTAALENMSSPSSVKGYDAFYASEPILAEEKTSLHDEVEENTSDIAFLESRAHASHVLMSQEALQFVVSQSTVREEQTEVLDMILEVAKGTYPNEDGWITVNKERIMNLLK